MTHQARYLLGRGDQLRIEKGRLLIEPASGLPVPDDWMRSRRESIVREILEAMCADAYEYLSYSTGRYGPRKVAGVTLQFVSVRTGESVYAIFNADLNRARTTSGGRIGAPLPDGEFRVGKQSAFCKLWQSAGLPLPDRLQRFHKRMGLLRGIVFSAERTSSERLNAQSITPLSATHDWLSTALLGHNSGTSKAQLGHNSGTTTGHKENDEDQAWRASQDFPATCDFNYGKTVIRECGNTGASSLASSDPREQTVDEWLAEYDSTPRTAHEPVTNRAP